MWPQRPRPRRPAPPAPAPAPEPVVDPEVEEARDFIAAAALIISGFAQDPTRIAVEVDPIGSVRLTEELFDDFVSFVTLLEPALELGAPVEEVAGPEVVANLAAFLAGEADDMGPQARRDLARALLEGRGMPRNPEVAVEVLGPLIDAGEALSILLLHEHYDLIAADRLYSALLLSAEGGNRGAYLDLNAAEQRLGIEGVLAAQGGAVSAYAAGDGGQADLARDAMRGHRTQRNYAQAYYHALLGDAGGDPGAGQRWSRSLRIWVGSLMPPRRGKPCSRRRVNWPWPIGWPLIRPSPNPSPTRKRRKRTSRPPGHCF